MRNWAKWRAEQAQRSARASKAATARWEAYHAACAGSTPRESRRTELTIRDSHRPLQILSIFREPTGHSWGRAIVSLNGQRIGKRTLAATGLGKLIAEAIR